MKSHAVTLVSCALVAGVLCGFASAERSLPSANPMVTSVESAEGTIAGVDLEKKSFTLRVGSDGHTLELKVTDRTAFKLDGKDSSMAEAVKTGRTAKVSHEDKVASRVDVKSS